MNKIQPIPRPRNLRPNEYLVIEYCPPKARKWRPILNAHMYERGTEHNAHGLCAVYQKRDPESKYRLAIYSRALIAGGKP